MKRSLDGIMKMKSKTDERTASVTPSSTNSAHGGGSNSLSAKYLKQPVKPETAFGLFLTQARKAARKFLPKEIKLPITRSFCEIECRIGVLKAPFGVHAMRVTSSGPKQVAGGASAPAFKCDHIEPRCAMESGVSRTHFSHWTQAGLSEVSPISLAFGMKDVQVIKKDLVEKEYIETVYAGYPEDRRVCFPGLHPPPSSESAVVVVGKMEYKDKLCNMDLAIPAATYDVRITLSAEKALDSNVKQVPPPGWTSKRIKRRRSYSRRDQSFAWQLDVTEVTTSSVNNSNHTDVTYEIEMEILPTLLLQLINETDEQKAQSKAEQMGHQLWYMLQQINPLSDVSDVEDYLKNHPNTAAVRLALAQCAALKSFVDHQKSSPHAQFMSPIGSREGVSSQPPTHFMGCMPVNFSRHNIEEIQRAPDNAYFCSEKTDGVRHLLVFTGDTVVLVDRALRGKQPIHSSSNPNSSKEDPMQHILSLIQPGTVFDGEVVMNRKVKRPIFIVFDVMCTGTQAVLHLPFEQRLQHLRRATFRTADAKRDMFDPKDVTNSQVALPLVRKNFVQRTDLADMLSKVVEERGMRTYCNGVVHNHLTDGIIFQPNLPYVCGTDVNLLKWKYLDTVTIDVQLLPPRQQHGGGGGSDEEDALRVGCLGEEGTLVDMSRHVHLPRSERLRLEADRAEAGGNIAEVGFDPETGEWYYLTMRSDKVAPNHISTVLGTLLELAESLTTEELIYRMSVPAGGRDSYRKDFRGMLKQLLDFQKKKMKTTTTSSSSQAHR